MSVRLKIGCKLNENSLSTFQFCSYIPKKFRDTPFEGQRQHKLNQSQSGHYKRDEDDRERSRLREVAIFNKAQNRHGDQIPLRSSFTARIGKLFTKFRANET